MATRASWGALQIAKAHYSKNPYSGSANSEAKHSVNSRIVQMANTVPVPKGEPLRAVVLDAITLGTTQAICMAFRGRPDGIHVNIPNGCEFERFNGDTHDNAKRISSDVYVFDQMLYDWIKERSQKKTVHVAFFDYCCTASGNSHCRPKDDIVLFFKRGLLANEGIFAVTFSVRDPKGSSGYRQGQRDIRDFIRNAAESSGYHEIETFYMSYAGMYVLFFRFQVNIPPTQNVRSTQKRGTKRKSLKNVFHRVVKQKRTLHARRTQKCGTKRKNTENVLNRITKQQKVVKRTLRKRRDINYFEDDDEIDAKTRCPAQTDYGICINSAGNKPMCDEHLKKYLKDTNSVIFSPDYLALRLKALGDDMPIDLMTEEDVVAMFYSKKFNPKRSPAVKITKHKFFNPITRKIYNNYSYFIGSLSMITSCHGNDTWVRKDCKPIDDSLIKRAKSGERFVWTPKNDTFDE